MKIQTALKRRASVGQVTALPKAQPMGKILLRSCAILLILICRFEVGILWPFSYSSPFQMASAKVAMSREEDSRSTTENFLEQYIEPYDWYKINNVTESEDGDLPGGHTDYQFLGPIEIVLGTPSNLGSPNNFACSFGLYSRNRSLVSIETQEILYTVHRPMPNKDIEEVTSLTYHFNMTKFKENPFDPRKRTIIIIAGFLSGDNVPWMHEVKDAWLALEDVNVILVHWNHGNSGLYESAVSNTRIVARQIVIMLYYLARWHNVDFKSEQFRQSIYLVGHSCGAHIAGYVGQELGGQVARITGLDPAGPIYNSKTNPRHLLGPLDAELVDIIHTNAGSMNRYLHIGAGFIKKATAAMRRKMMILGYDNTDDEPIIFPRRLFDSGEAFPWYGIDKQLGHIDYYVNGGLVQPGCNDELRVCDHNRAIGVYLKTLEYELHARRAYGHDSETIRAGLHRLQGFKAKDYDEFRSGANFMLYCPNLIVQDLLQYDREELDKSYKLCTIPLDFVTPIAELKKELAQEYGVRFEHSSESENQQHSPAPKYYFDTLPDKPIVSDTYLLRVHMDKESSVAWQVGCQFFSYINAAGPHKKLYSIADYAPKFALPHQIGKFYGIVLPLLNPNDWRFAFPSRRKIMDKLHGLIGRTKVHSLDRIRKLLPNTLSIGVTYTSQRTESILTSIWNFGKSMTTSVSELNSNASETCSFRYTGFELRPFSRALNNSFSLWFSGDILAEKGQIPNLRAHSELVHLAVEQLNGSRKIDLNSELNRIGLAEVGLK